MFNIQNGMITLYRESGIKAERIPTGTYGLGADPMIGYYLYAKDDMAVPSVTYGDADDKSSRILKTFTSRRGKNTGVMLEGTKGSGKTLQAKMLSSACQARDIPTIVIGSAFSGEGFINFLSAIKQPVMIMIDEFDKQYPEKEDQNALLTLLDGVGGYDKLYVLTKNDGYVSEFLRNRPSRIFYTFSYKKLPRATMDDYLDRNLVNKAFLTDFNTLYELSSDLNFDVMQAIVEELNRFPEDKFSDVLSIMGITVTDASYSTTKEVTKLMINGVDYTADIRGNDMDRMSPSRLFAGSSYDVYLNSKKEQKGIQGIPNIFIVSDWDDEEDDFEDSYHLFRVKYDDRYIKQMGASGYVFAGETEQGDKFEIRIQEKEQKKFSDYAFGNGGFSGY